MRSHPFYRTLYGQVLIATAVGVLLGHFYPETGSAMKPLGDGFIKLVKNDHRAHHFCARILQSASSDRDAGFIRLLGHPPMRVS